MFNLKPRLSRDGKLAETRRGWILSIPAGPRNEYRLAQLDDHLAISRRAYPWRSPATLSLEARASSDVLPGTWGFGLWNDPYGFSFGPGNGFLRLPALPNTAWFFYSSPTNYLSFRDDKPANGFLAQLFASPAFHPSLFLAAAALLFARKAARRLLSRVIDEDAVRVLGGSTRGLDSSPSGNVTGWHAYEIQWASERTRFLVDGSCLLDSTLSPRSPMGLVIWIDNQYAGFRPDGKISWGLEENQEPAWLEIRDLVVKSK